MTTGGPPFTATNRYKLMEQITKAELAVPAKLSRDLVTLIGGLMNRSVLHRLGSEQKGGVAHLKRLKWFEPVDWVFLTSTLFWCLVSDYVTVCLSRSA